MFLVFILKVLNLWNFILILLHLKCFLPPTEKYRQEKAIDFCLIGQIVIEHQSLLGLRPNCKIKMNCWQEGKLLSEHSSKSYLTQVLTFCKQRFLYPYYFLILPGLGGTCIQAHHSCSSELWISAQFSCVHQPGNNVYINLLMKSYMRFPTSWLLCIFFRFSSMSVWAFASIMSRE